MNLKEIISTKNEILMKIYESNGELTPDLEIALKESTEALSLKIDRIKHLIDFLKSDSETLKSKGDEFIHASRVSTNAIESLKKFVKSVMRDFHTQVLEGEEYRFYLKRSIPKLIIEDETLIPKEFYKIIQNVTPDHERIRQELALGNLVPGCRLEETKALCMEVNRKLPL
jgi:hypothetical protein